MHIPLPNARGYVNLLDIDNGLLTISGWMLLPGKAMDSFKVILDGDPVHSAPLTESADISEAFPFIPHTDRSAFSASIPYETKSGIRKITVIGYRKNRERAKLDTCFSEELYPNMEFPETLVIRVAGRVNGSFF